jgi:hypothetical protein
MYVYTYIYIYIYIRPYRLWGPPSFLFSVYRGPLTGVNWPERDVNHSPSSSAEVKNAAPMCLHGVDKKNLSYKYVHTYAHTYIHTYIRASIYCVYRCRCFCFSAISYVIVVPCIHTRVREDTPWQVTSLGL